MTLKKRSAKESCFGYSQLFNSKGVYSYSSSACSWISSYCFINYKTNDGGTPVITKLFPSERFNKTVLVSRSESERA